MAEIEIVQCDIEVLCESIIIPRHQLRADTAKVIPVQALVLATLQLNDILKGKDIHIFICIIEYNNSRIAQAQA